MEKKNLVIAFGGVSPEHEVSVLTAIQAASALQNNDWVLTPLYITKEGSWLTGNHLFDLESYKDISKLTELGLSCFLKTNADGSTLLQYKPPGWFSSTKEVRIDAMLLAFHGSDGENGAFQGLCETLNLPYTGSGVTASALGMDKWMSKELCRKNAIPVVDDLLIHESTWIQNQKTWINNAKKIGFPLFVKPVSLGSSIGVKKADSETALIDAVEEAFRYDSRLLIEKAVSPLIEINCSVLGDINEAKASVCEQPVGSEELLSFQDKYLSGDDGSKGMASAGRIIPAPITDDLTEKIRDYAISIFKLLGCSGVARLDFLMNSITKEIFFNEINTIPGSFSFYLWDASGVSFDELLDNLLALSIKHHKKKNSRVRSYDVNLLSKKATQGLKGLKGNK